jgi:hypothetical protein
MAEAREERGGMSCPHCGLPLDVDAVGRTAAVTCGKCGGPVMLETETPPAQERDDLDGLRIRQVYQLRRSLYRARRYWLVGTGVCAVAAGQIVWKLFTSSASMGVSNWRATVLAVACIVGAIFCFRQATQLGRSARQSTLREPEQAPDLSSLSDGSQHWKNLEAMGRQEAED